MLNGIIKLTIRALILQSIMSAIGITPGVDTGLISRVIQMAAGVPLAGATPLANGGIANPPTLFPMKTGVALAGEAGAEAVMPLKRDKSGNLGVSGPSITVNNYTGEEVTVDRVEQLITIAVGKARIAVENDYARSMVTGQGTYARALEAGTTIRRKAS